MFEIPEYIILSQETKINICSNICSCYFLANLLPSTK
nr:MAG TPA: hypothetical protein [Caudoviricetes sp.]